MLVFALIMLSMWGSFFATKISSKWIITICNIGTHTYPISPNTKKHIISTKPIVRLKIVNPNGAKKIKLGYAIDFKSSSFNIPP